MIALNIVDCTRYDTIIRSLMIAPHIGAKRTIDPEPTKNLDGDCVIMECPDEQARSIVDFLRTVVDRRAKQYPVRAYISGPRGGWKKIA